MNVTILGCRSGMPAHGQASSGYLVSIGGGAEETRVLLDCGPGVATALSSLIDPAMLDAIVLSHVHLDHCYDLLPIGKSLLAKGLSYPTAGRPPQSSVEIRRVPLYVPAGSAALFHRLAALFPVTTVPALDRAFELAFDMHEYDPGDYFTVGSAEVHLELLAHAAPNCGVRVSCADGTLAYTGDTGRTPALRTLARGADLLLAECTLSEPDSGPHGHLCAEDAADVAADAAVGQLVLTHFGTADPDWLEASRRRAAVRFGGPVHIATPSARFPVRSAREAML
ncbi:MBL fold metallo-hydrolase [Amycolatopsis sp.]|jgi:ribonuclease BN (tRNA processing enzyme)|uniref:MBL fold metallo-hydrolase n=1 Tax=Amycolatopsis sp. TaxID=37632 RepID=UPI002DFF7B12|nr:MBL fold metallo-hydrolase [Amycolatopsis sp.]